MRLGIASFVLCLACTAEPVTSDATTGDSQALECLYDGDCGGQAVCHRGACVDQCVGEECCTLRGELEPPAACEASSDCGDAEVCEAGTCRPERSRCAEPARVLG